MIVYRTATAADASSIAHLHGLSWQQTYRGMWSDAFLDGPVFDDRQQVWRNRFYQPNPQQYIVVAEEVANLVGFVCAYADHDAVWGTLLDNLHVRDILKGRGVGTALFRAAARWSYQVNPEAGLYLWVLTQNIAARKFYAQLGGTDQEQVVLKSPDRYDTACNRYVWPRPSELV